MLRWGASVEGGSAVRLLLITHQPAFGPVVTWLPISDRMISHATLALYIRIPSAANDVSHTW